MDKKILLNIILLVIIILLLPISGENKSLIDTIRDSFEKEELEVTEEEMSINQINGTIPYDKLLKQLKKNENKPHKKKSFGPKVVMFPEPAMVIGSYDENGIPNVMSASWFGIVNSQPLMVAVSLRPATYSYHNVVRTQAFTVNIPSYELAPFVTFVGKYSGKDMNKFEVTGYHAVKGDVVNAPYVKEFPIVVECEVVEMIDLGSHRQFIGKVMEVKIDEDILGSNDLVDFDKFSPLIVGKGGFFMGGAYLGNGNKLRKVFEDNRK